jgi:glycosyltransferase involved in cell wall biosynthesis
MSTETVKPRVSVIIPVYQGDRFLAEAVESVLNQNFTNYEIIVIDDGSTDNSHAVLQPYYNSIHYVFQENQGVAAARNRGIQIAKGELIAFLDQDDFWLSDKLASQVAYFESQPNLGMVNSGWQIVNQQGDLLGKVEPWHQLPNLNLEAWVLWKPVLPSTLMFKRKWLEQVGGFNPQFYQATDVDLVLRLALIGCQADWVCQTTVCYREHPENSSRNTPQQAEETWAVLEQFFSRPNLPEKVRQLRNQSCYQTLVWAAWRLYHTGHISQMVRYLEKSISYTPYSGTKTISDWVTNFIGYASEYGCKINADALSKSAEWQQLMKYVLN